MASGSGTLSHAFDAMASRCELQLDGAPAELLEAAAAAAAAEVHRIEAKYSRYRADSVVSRINAAAGAAPLAVDDETASLLAFAAQLHRQSEGRFDITSGVLRRAWNFKRGVPPSTAEVAALLPLIGWSGVEFDGRSIRLPHVGMELDFGGFGKEYAADRAAAVVQAAGVGHGWLNLGGDIRVVGPRGDGSAWRFGIQHPRQEDTTVASVELQQGALATSGDYERFFEFEGRRYCHLLDAASGQPVNDWQSISASAPLCVAAGALCTIAMLLGPQALAFLDAQGARYLAIDAQGRLHANGIGIG